MLKPGPKLGSVYKRRYLEHQFPERRPTTPTKMIRKNAPREEQDPDATTCSEFSALDEEALRYSKYMQTVSELYLPFNESSSLEIADTAITLLDFSTRRENVLSITYSALGLTPDIIKQLSVLYDMS